MAKAKDKKKTRGTQKVRKATKKQRRKKMSKSGNPKADEPKPSPFHFLRTGGECQESDLPTNRFA
jgi:hypothetical protein